VPTGENAYARAGSWLNHVVTYGNAGTAASGPVEITVELPTEAEFCAHCVPGWTDLGDSRYLFSDDPLAAGEQRRVMIVARVPEFITLPEETTGAQSSMTVDWSSQVTLSGGGTAVAAQTFTVAATYALGPAGQYPMGLAVDPVRNVVYIGLSSAGMLAIIDPSVQTINLVWDPMMPAPIQGVAYLNDKIYLTHPAHGYVTVIDAITRVRIKTILMPFGAKPFGIGGANDRVYVSLFNTNEVAVIDATTDTMIATGITGGHPCLVGAFGDRAYVANHSHFYSTWGLNAASIDAMDEMELRAMVEQYVQQNPDDTGITVVDPNGATSRIMTGKIGFFGIAVDPTRNLIYATQRDLGHEGLYVFDGTDHSLIRHVPLSKPYAVAVNPNTNHVFVVMAQPEINRLYIFDGDQDYALIRIEDLLQQSIFDGMMNGGQGVGVMNDWVYVANYGDASMTSLPDLPGTPPEYDPPVGAPFVRHWLYDTQQPGHRPMGLPVGYPETRPFVRQDFEYGFPGGVTQDVLFLNDVMTGTDQIFEFKVFIEPGGGGSAGTLMLNTSDEVSVAWNSTTNEKVSYGPTQDALRFGNYLAPPTSDPSFFRAYLRFPLGAIPSGAVIESAVLQMHVFDERFPGGGSLNAGVYSVASGWTEAGLLNTASWTWATLPSFNPAPASATTIATLDQWYYWNITPLVQAWVNGSTPNNGIMVSGSPEGGVTQAMGARSRAGAYPDRGPILMVTYSVPGAPGHPVSPGYDGTHGHWLRFSDMWTSGMPEYACQHVEPGVYFDYGVRQGFGIVWCTLHYSPNPAYALYQLGKPLGNEWAGSGMIQRFQEGIMFSMPYAAYPDLWGDTYIAYNDGWWQKYPY
jgi:hypothetical protein